jgi:hypothetical protein
MVMTAPRRDRPEFPASYGIATGEEGMLEWERVDTTLAATPVYWVATVRPDGSPHVTPIWGGWDGAAIHIEGGGTTVWARALAFDPRVAVGCDHDGLQITVRGIAHREMPADFEAVADVYAAKYPYRPEPGSLWVIRPRTILAWDTSTLEAFAHTPTRFTFEEDRP